VKLGIGGRLLAAHVILSLLVLVAMEAFLPPILRAELERQLDGRLRVAASALAAEIEEGEPPQIAAARVARTTSFRMSVVGADGFLSADSAVERKDLRAAGSHAERPEVVAAREGNVGGGERTSATTGIETRYVAVRARGGSVARAAQDVAALDESMAAAKRAVLLAAGAGVILAAMLGAAASHAAGRSVRDLTRAARRMADGDLSELSVPRGPGELADVAAALERLARDLAAHFDKLTRERDLLGAVLAAMEEAVLVLRPDGRLLLSNETAGHLLSLPGTAHGQPLIETVRFPALLDAVHQAAAGTAARLELVLKGPPRRELLGRAAPLPAGSEAAVVVVLRDVTELRRLEAMRRDFVSNASHELRTPVAAIRGYAESLAHGALDDRPTAERFVAGLSRQAERLTALVDDLLDLSRIESGGLRLSPEEISAEEVLQRAVEGARERADRKGLRLAIEAPPQDLRVRADRRAIDMVVGNLVDNAIKYTPTGGAVTVSAQQADGAVRFVVRDSGPGIEEQHLARIFERFYRVDSGRSRDIGGTGLGLAIAKHVAQQSGGDVGVESRPGAGSRFWLRLPAA